MTPDFLSASLPMIGPEMILAVGAMALLMLGVFIGEKSARLITKLAVVLLLVSALWLIFVAPNGVAFGGSFVLDPFARFM
ncbi:MAG: NADH-quinone oxidoreductase subunit N, partial [Sphingomonadales bacterium]